MKRFLVFATVGFASCSIAVTYSTGFEAPTWDATGLINSFATQGWVGSGLNTTPGFRVVTGTVFQGSQAVEFRNNSNNVTTYSAGPATLPTSTTYMYGEVMLNISSFSSGRGFGIQSSNQGHRIYIINESGNIRLKAFNALSFTTTTLQTFTTSPLGQWNKLALEVDIPGKKINGWFNNTKYEIATNAAFGQFDSVINMTLLSRAEASSQGVARFDNFLRTTDVVPEPASLCAVGIGLLAVLRRKRKN